MSDDWTPGKKWGMDLLKSFVAFAVVALITSLVLDRYSERRAKQRAQDDTVFQLRVDALREFRRATLAYDSAARAAFADLYQWVGKSKSPAMLRYEQEAFPAWKAAVEETLFRNSDDAALRRILDELITKIHTRHAIYDQLVDSRLDKDDSTAIDPSSRRAQFEQLSQSIAALRAQALGRLDYLVLERPRSQ